MTIAIIGASGFIGQALTRHLLETTDSQLRLFCRSADSLVIPEGSDTRVTRCAGTVFDATALSAALQHADVAYYLIHMMDSDHDDFVRAEHDAAATFAAAALAAGVPRVVYLGGLGDDRTALSPHLASRHHTGELLRAQLPLVIELRASMIIARGSVAYDIIRAMAHRLPVLVVPRWSDTPTQPIALADMLAYLAAAAAVPIWQSEVVEVGGPEAIAYPQLVARYARFIGRHAVVFAVPGVPRRAARWWLWHFLRRKDAVIGQAMIDSLHNPMVVTDDSARRLFPHVVPRPVAEAFD